MVSDPSFHRIRKEEEGQRRTADRQHQRRIVSERPGLVSPRSAQNRDAQNEEKIPENGLEKTKEILKQTRFSSKGGLFLDRGAKELQGQSIHQAADRQQGGKVYSDADQRMESVRGEPSAGDVSLPEEGGLLQKKRKPDG